MSKDLQGGSRTGYRIKRKKTNLVLNSLIALVILLIVIVSSVIFFGDDESKTQKKDEKVQNTSSEKGNKEEEELTAEDSAKENEIEGTTDQEEANNPEETEEDAKKEDVKKEDSEEADKEKEVVTEGGSDANVKKTIENPGWDSVGTSQSGEHVAVYDQNSTDWQEMSQAISYATGIDQSNMTIWYLGNNGSPNQAVGTVSTKDKSQTYRVYIDWVDGQGWKPVKVEELAENDKD